MAKYGQKVILFGTPYQLDNSWGFSSIFLEKLLGTLGGRSCFTNPAPFQVLSDRSRITIHNEIPVQEELTREFGKAAPAAEALLAHLLETGTRLNLLFWDNHGLVWPSLKGKSLARYLCLRRKLSITEMNTPLSNRLEALEAGPREFLTNLFQGLSLVPLESLTVADAALLWAQANRPENLAEPDFSTLLDKRLEQFHGVSEPLDALEHLEFKGNTFSQGRLKDRGEFKASQLFIGDLANTSRLIPAPIVSTIASPDTSRFITTNLFDKVSPLLADQVILGTKQPLRLALERDAGETTTSGRISTTGPVRLESIKNQLEIALPFAGYTLTADQVSNNPPPPADNTHRPATMLFASPLQLGKNIFCADSSALYPGMVATGGALLGWTLLNRLCPRAKDSK